MLNRLRVLDDEEELFGLSEGILWQDFKLS